MTTYTLVNGKFGDWKEAYWRAAMHYTENKGIAAVIEGEGVYVISPDQYEEAMDEQHGVIVQFKSDKNITGAVLKSRLRFSVEFELSLDELKALKGLKFKVPNTTVNDNIFGAIAKLKIGLDRAE